MILWVVVDGVDQGVAHRLKWLKALRPHGQYTDSATTPYPPVTVVSFATLFYGLDATHLNFYTEYPHCESKIENVPFLNVFELLHRGGKRSAVVGCWPKMVDLLDGAPVDNYLFDPRGRGMDTGTTELALELIEAREHDVLLVYYEKPDWLGHNRRGAQTPAYRQALKDCDRDIQRLWSLLDPKQDSLIVTSDHGRNRHDGGQTHGKFRPSDMRVPLLVAGRGAKTLSWHLPALLDIAPTVLRLQGLPVPPTMRGHSLVHVPRRRQRRNP